MTAVGCGKWLRSRPWNPQRLIVAKGMLRLARIREVKSANVDAQAKVVSNNVGYAEYRFRIRLLRPMTL